MRPILPCLLILCAAATLLPAQTDDSGKSRKPTGRIANFMYTSMPEGIENPVSIMSGEHIVQVTLSKRATSEPVKIPEDGILRVVRKVENPKDPLKPAYAILAEALVPDNVNKALVILVPYAQPRGERVFQAKIQDLAEFKGGDYMYMNLTKLDVGVEMGKTKLGVKPGETKIFKVSGSLSEATNVPISYNFFDPKDQQWRMLSASTVVMQPTRREICIFSWDPQFNRIDYHGITFPVAREPN